MLSTHWALRLWAHTAGALGLTLCEIRVLCLSGS